MRTAKRAAIAGGATTLIAYSASRANVLAPLVEKARSWRATG